MFARIPDGENCGAHGPMRSVEHAADRRGETMHDAETRVGQRKSAEQARPGHAGSRFSIVAIGERTQQAGRSVTNSVQAEVVRHRIRACANIRTRSVA